MTMTIASNLGAAVNKAPVSRGRRALRLAAPLTLAGVVALGTIGVRSIVASNAHPTAHPAATAAGMPTSSKIEQTWGVRFTNVRVLAGRGLVDVRYQVIDPNKATKLHADGVKNLPRLRVDGGATVNADSAMFHFHTIADTTSAGRGFDILYGNSHGALRPGGEITLLLSDGEKLEHVPVTD
jgi:hypothetical protein